MQVDGQKFRGYGTSKSLAKQAAAEAALLHLTKTTLSPELVPLPRSAMSEDDKVPWATLASFAMFKLFHSWQDASTTPAIIPPASSRG